MARDLALTSFTDLGIIYHLELQNDESSEDEFPKGPVLEKQYKEKSSTVLHKPNKYHIPVL
jgi:hypothetical protein